MYQNCCKKCGSMSLHTEVKGNNTGLYCDDCGAWLGKDGFRAFKHSQKEGNIQNNKENVAELMSVKFDFEKLYGEIMANGQMFFQATGYSINDFKKLFITWVIEKFDESIGRDLGINFPYKIGNMTFYNLSEIEKYIEGTQYQKKE